MARDNHPRERQARKIARKQGNRASADRILIVCEGSETEVNYFDEIRKTLKLPTANIHAIHSAYGTSPHQVVDYARDLFINGNIESGIQPRAFEKVFAVFDRDSHERYFDALNNAQQTNLRNDQNTTIEFKAVVSNINATTGYPVADSRSSITVAAPKLCRGWNVNDPSDSKRC